jgi:tetratricopeptide (TPR) repeat protein
VRFGLALLLTSYLLGQFLSCSSSARNHYILGKDLQTDKKYAEALAEFEKGLQTEPDSPRLNYEKARTLYMMEKWQDAITAFEAFMKLTDSLKETYGKERWDADFSIKRCKQQLGLPIDDAAAQEGGDSGKTDSQADSGNEDTMGGIHMVRH